MSVVFASPASAIVLPEGQRITVVDGIAGAVYEASPSSAALTPIGAAAIDGWYLSAVDVDPAGQGFALLVAGSPGGDPGSSRVAPFDAATGAVGDPIDVTVAGSPGLDCSALDLRGGALFTSCFTGAGKAMRTQFGILDPSTGALEVLRSFDDAILFSAFASDPLSGQFWAFEFREVDGYSGSWIVDPDDWGFTTYLELDHPVWGADYDRAGRLIVSGAADDLPGPYAALLLLNPDEGLFDPIGALTLDDVTVDPSRRSPLTVWGSASPLPETGGRVEDAMPLAMGAVMLVLAGIALVWSGRIEEEGA